MLETLIELPQTYWELVALVAMIGGLYTGHQRGYRSGYDDGYEDGTDGKLHKRKARNLTRSD
ncbi:hypothetical protein SAMN06269185_1053 [Natronoarchaeum philippinense]|uniref:Uncharacterized protein n=1 Tax=Natronoarchaeum philippinense TaxID=558529 RepID=A0A285NEN6_NATPI|nr:hypothetical protein [Natronoarchaeum philippinense]SNZ06111.1 hypothetical protein SAMN06269185_1053 [Natronoarchaeum philippinense]